MEKPNVCSAGKDEHESQTSEARPDDDKHGALGKGGCFEEGVAGVLRDDDLVGGYARSVFSEFGEAGGQGGECGRGGEAGEVGVGGGEEIGEGGRSAGSFSCGVGVGGAGLLLRGICVVIFVGGCLLGGVLGCRLGCL